MGHLKKKYHGLMITALKLVILKCLVRKFLFLNNIEYLEY